jgi:DNA-binding transcriptional MocR family regulator
MHMTTVLVSALRFKPDSGSAQPLYLQLAAFLTEGIRGGAIAVGSHLPSERSYAQRLGVSRTTVTAAYQELKASGFLRAFVGRGAIVISDDPERDDAGPISWPAIASRFAQPAAPGTTSNGTSTISFGNGWLHPALVPHEELADCARSIVRASAAFKHAAPILGLQVLREALIDGPFKAASIKVAPDEVLITGGAQQGLNVLARALLCPGDVVLCESPTWHGAFRAFRSAGAQVIGVPIDREGIDPDALEDALLRHRPKFVYLIPSFQCPTGRLLGLARRRRVIATCARLHTPIVESHVYGDIAFGQAIPTLKHLDEAGIVIHQGSASKTMSADLRLGWLVAPKPAMALLSPAKASLDLATPTLNQAVLARFLASGAYARHLPRLRLQLQQRRDALTRALAVHCPELRYAMPQGGLYLWAQLPKPMRSHEVEAVAAVAGVTIRGGDAFLAEGGPSGCIRLCYASPELDRIEAGARLLGTALSDVARGRKQAASQAAPLADV